MAEKQLKSLKLHGLDDTYVIPTKPEDIGAAPAYTYGTQDIEPGSVSDKPNGTLHFVIE